MEHLDRGASPVLWWRRRNRRSGSTTDRPGLRALLGYARDGDVIVVHTLDRLGRTVRDTRNLIHDLSARGVGVRNLADPIGIDSSNPDDPMAQLAVVLLALFGQMERTYTLERAAHARAVATAKAAGSGARPVVDAHKLAYAAHLREAGDTIAEIIAETGIIRSSLYRHLPPRRPDHRRLHQPHPAMTWPAVGTRLMPTGEWRRRDTPVGGAAPAHRGRCVVGGGRPRGRAAVAHGPAVVGPLPGQAA